MVPPDATVDARSVTSALQTLGLDRSAGWKDIRAAYALKVKQAHPDSSAGRGSRFLLERTLRAYRVLKEAYPAEVRRSPVRSVRSVRVAGTKPTRDVSRAATAEAGFGALGQTALTAPDPARRAEACVKLGQTGKRSAAAYLRASLYDDDDQVVVAAASALGRLKVRAASGDYDCVFESANRVVRVSVLRAAVETGPAECFRKLFVRALKDDDRAVRRTALTGLSRINTAAQV